MNDTRKRVLWVDIIRIIAVFLVIMMHESDSVLYYWGKRPIANGANLTWWTISVAYKSLASICVPLFFMISGYLALQSKDSAFVFIRKRLKKILIPLITWSVIYAMWEMGGTEISFTLGNLKSFIRGFLEGPTYFHLWFLYAIVPLYLVTPIFKYFTQYTDSKDLLYLFVLWLVSEILLEIIDSTKNIHISLLSQPFISGYLGYYLAGYFLGKRDYSLKTTWWAFLLSLVILAGKTIGILILVMKTGSFDTGLFEYMLWHTQLLTVSGFISLKGFAQYYFNSVSEKTKRNILMLSNSAFGIYLIHVMIGNTLANSQVSFSLGNHIHPLFEIPFLTLIIFVVSFLLIHIIKKLPVLKVIVP